MLQVLPAASLSDSPIYIFGHQMRSADVFVEQYQFQFQFLDALVQFRV